MKQAKPFGVVLAVLLAATLACGSAGVPTDAPDILTATPQVVATVGSDATDAPADHPTDASPEAPDATATSEPTAEPTPKPVEGYLGDYVELDGIALAALQIEDPTEPSSFYQKGEGMRLVAVEVVLANIDVEPFSVNPLDFAIQDEEGFTYQVELGGRDGGHQLDLVTLSPGERVRGWLAFEVEEAAVLRGVRYNPTFSFSDTNIQTSLSPRPDGVEPLEITAREIPVLANLGDVVEQGGYSLSASTLEDPTPKGSFVTVLPGYRLVAVEVVIGNIDGAELSVNPLSMFLIDSDGFVYSAELGGSAHGQIDLTDLQAGDRVKGLVAFQIPDEAKPEAVKYEMNSFTGLFIMTGLATP